MNARRIVDHAADAGVNFIDTADVYADGRSEAIVGPAIRAKRPLGAGHQGEGHSSGGSGGPADGCEALADSLVPPGHPSTPGFTDPAYPVEGRFRT